MKVAVVILNYNGVRHLETYLRSVIKYSGDADIWVADNASTDNSMSFLATLPNVNTLSLEDNHGYAGGYNRALAQIKADVYVLLNSDVEVSENWLLKLTQPFDFDHKVVACQPKVLSYLEKRQFEYAGAAGGFLDKFGYPFCRGRLFDTCELDQGQYNSGSEIFWASGACLAVRSKEFLDFGGFDERFFAHMEEIDLCWRFKSAGYSIKYIPESVVYHLGGGTLKKSNPRKTFLNYRNGLALLFKNLPFSRLFTVLPVRLILDGVSGIKLLIDGKPLDFVAVLKAHFSFYGMIPYLLKQSKGFERSANGLSNYSVVWQYFVKNVKSFKDLPNA
ncbi:MAG: glycosyltransferase family 2 protein [Cytophagales bacterium]|nr:glycosyltransferase family 2 protein [Cytophagales bacterium]